MTDLEVEIPHPIPSFDISYIFEFSSFYSQESISSFLHLDSFKSFESFSSFFFPFFAIHEKAKFDLSSSLQKMGSLIALPGYIDSSKKGLEKYDNFFVP